MIKKQVFIVALIVALAQPSFALASDLSRPAGSAAATSDFSQALLELAQGRWSALSRTAVAITGDVKFKDNVLIFNGNTRYAIEPTERKGNTSSLGGSMEVHGAPFFRLRLLGQDQRGSVRRSRPYLRDGNPLCGDNDSYLYVQLETFELGGVKNAVLTVRIFEPPKKGAHGRPHYCAAYNYLREIDKPAQSS